MKDFDCLVSNVVSHREDDEYEKCTDVSTWSGPWAVMRAKPWTPKPDDGAVFGYIDGVCATLKEARELVVEFGGGWILPLPRKRMTGEVIALSQVWEWDGVVVHATCKDGCGFTVGRVERDLDDYGLLFASAPEMAKTLLQLEWASGASSACADDCTESGDTCFFCGGYRYDVKEGLRPPGTGKVVIDRGHKPGCELVALYKKAGLR